MSKLPKVKVAAIQAEPIVLDRDATITKACQLTAEAARGGAQLVVFPELFIPTYINGSVWGRGLSRFGTPPARSAWSRLWQNSVQIPSESTERLCQAARDAGAMIAMGLHEREPATRTLYNTFLLVGADGSIVGKHRKLMPTNHERMVHGCGDGSTLRVFETSLGRIGGLICWENLMPLARYALYSQGEQIHLAPTAFDDEMAIVNARNTALEGGVFVISVAMLLRKSSYPADFEFRDELAAANEYLGSGGSCIVGPDGSLRAGPLWKEEGILHAELDLNETVGAAQLLDAVGHYSRSEVLGLRINHEAQKPVDAGP